jgi:predicted metal-dependent RNase
MSYLAICITSKRYIHHAFLRYCHTELRQEIQHTSKEPLVNDTKADVSRKNGMILSSREIL